MTAIDSGRIIRSYTQQIEATADAVFPLLCPVREAEWLDGWAGSCQVLHSQSGLVEPGCVFRTRRGDGPETIWTVTRHDPAAHAVEFVRVTSGVMATSLAIRVEPAGAGASRVHIRYTHTPTSERGRELLAESWSEEDFRRDMAWWQESMNHWLRSGEMLRRHSPA